MPRLTVGRSPMRCFAASTGCLTCLPFRQAGGGPCRGEPGQPRVSRGRSRCGSAPPFHCGSVTDPSASQAAIRRRSRKTPAYAARSAARPATRQAPPPWPAASGRPRRRPRRAPGPACPTGRPRPSRQCRPGRPAVRRPSRCEGPAGPAHRASTGRIQRREGHAADRLDASCSRTAATWCSPACARSACSPDTATHWPAASAVRGASARNATSSITRTANSARSARLRSGSARGPGDGGVVGVARLRGDDQQQVRGSAGGSRAGRPG